MGLGKFVKKTIDVVGTVAKVGVELGADAIGAIAEKVDDNPESKEKFKNIGKNIGQNIKTGTTKIAESSEDVVDNAFESGSKLCKNLGQNINEKINEVKAKKTTTSEESTEHTYSKSYTVSYEEVNKDEKVRDEAEVKVDSDRNEENYGVISIDNEEIINENIEEQNNIE